MAEPVSMVNLLVNRYLPDDLKNNERIYDKKGVEELMAEMARKYPDQFSDVAQKIGDLGRNLVYSRGETFDLDDFAPVIDRENIFAEIDEKEKQIRGNDQLSNAEKQKAIKTLYAQYTTRLADETNTAAFNNRNNLAMSVLSGARGKKPQLRDLITSPGYYEDSKGNVAGGFIRNSFSEGLRPGDYLAGTFAARSAVTDSKRATQQGGFLSKTLSRANIANYITEDDCGTSNGIALSTKEKDIRGRVLQKPTEGFSAGTVVDRKVYKKLQSKDSDVVVRSPITCSAENGICSKCFGVMAEGRFPKKGTHVGVTASDALGEPLAQSALSMKHVTSGGGEEEEFSGLDYIEQFLNSPKEFKNKTVVSTLEGQVGRVEEAPQGGQYVQVGGERHYVPPDRQLTVKEGDMLEAGDALTDGLIDPEDVIRYKGLGAGRKYYADRLSEMSEKSGAGMDKRQFEVLARGNIDHIRLDDPVEEGFLPDDVISYNKFLHRRKVPENTRQASLRDAKGKFLQAPALHYSVGSRVTRSMMEDLGKHGFDSVMVSEDEPTFESTMVGLQQAASSGDDWLARLGGSYLSRGLEEARTRAADTNIESNTNPIPRLAVTENYGKNIEETGKF